MTARDGDKFWGDKIMVICEALNVIPEQILIGKSQVECLGKLCYNK